MYCYLGVLLLLLYTSNPRNKQEETLLLEETTVAIVIENKAHCCYFPHFLFNLSILYPSWLSRFCICLLCFNFPFLFFSFCLPSSPFFLFLSFSHNAFFFLLPFLFGATGLEVFIEMWELSRVPMIRQDQDPWTWRRDPSPLGLTFGLPLTVF